MMFASNLVRRLEHQIRLFATSTACVFLSGPRKSSWIRRRRQASARAAVAGARRLSRSRAARSRPRTGAQAAGCRAGRDEEMHPVHPLPRPGRQQLRPTCHLPAHAAHGRLPAGQVCCAADDDHGGHAAPHGLPPQNAVAKALDAERKVYKQHLERHPGGSPTHSRRATSAPTSNGWSRTTTSSSPATTCTSSSRP